MSVVVRSFALVLSSALLASCLPSAAQTSQPAQAPPAVQNAQPAQTSPQAQIAPQAQHSKLHKVSKPRPGKEEKPPAPPQPPPPSGPLQQLSLDQMPAVPPQVSYQTGELTIISQNSTLGDILRAVRSRTGASFDVPPSATERVVGRFGPGPAREVLATLLNGSHFNYVMVGSPKDPNAMAELVLTPKAGGNTSMPANMGQSVAQQPGQMQPGESIAGETGMEGENAGDAPEENAEQAPPPEQQNADQEGAPQGFPTQPNGQPMVKTPQQLLQELQQQQLQQQQLQQQQQQQGQQPPGVNPQQQQPVVYPNPQPVQPPQRPQQ